MKYCPNCGKLLETELDFSKSLFNNKVTFIKRCKYCKDKVDQVTVKAE